MDQEKTYTLTEAQLQTLLKNYRSIRTAEHIQALRLLESLQPNTQEPARYVWYQLFDMDNGPAWVEVCEKYDPRSPECSELHKSVNWSDAAQVRGFTALFTHQAPQQPANARGVIEQLVDALENHDGNYKLSDKCSGKVDAALTAGRAALAPQASEPSPASGEREALVVALRTLRPSPAECEALADMLEADAQRIAELEAQLPNYPLGFKPGFTIQRPKTNDWSVFEGSFAGGGTAGSRQGLPLSSGRVLIIRPERNSEQ